MKRVLPHFFYSAVLTFTCALRNATVGFLLGLLWIYKIVISRPLHLVGGPACGCRFHPTCSDYAAEALRVHGPFRGVYLAANRLLRCSPLSSGGVDFVPPAHALRRRCVRSSSPRPTTS